MWFTFRIRNSFFEEAFISDNGISNSFFFPSSIFINGSKPKKLLQTETQTPLQRQTKTQHKGPTINGPKARTLPTERRLRATHPENSHARPRVNIYPANRNTCLNLKQRGKNTRHENFHVFLPKKNAGANTVDSPEPTGTGTTAIPSSSDSPCDGEHHRTYLRSHPQRQQPPNNSYIFVTKFPTLGEPQSIFKKQTKAGQDQRFESRHLPEKKPAKTNVNETAACQSQSPNVGSRC